MNFEWISSKIGLPSPDISENRQEWKQVPLVSSTQINTQHEPLPSQQQIEQQTLFVTDIVNKDEDAESLRILNWMREQQISELEDFNDALDEEEPLDPKEELIQTQKEILDIQCVDQFAQQ